MFDKIAEHLSSSVNNPDYYCVECGADEETGGYPAVCDDCRD